MAKRRKSKGKRRGKRKGKKGKKGGHKAAKHSLALEGSAGWDGYKTLTSNLNGQSVGYRLMQAPFDKGQRDAVMGAIKSGQLKALVVDNTRELQFVAGLKILQKVPIIKGPVNMVANAINSLGRQVGIKGKYKVF